MAEQALSQEAYVLEASLEGGGCSGYQFKLAFKERAEVNPEKEAAFNFDGVDVVVNSRAMLYLEGTTIDYHQGLNQRGFVFKNEAVKSTCGCGKSVQF